MYSFYTKIDEKGNLLIINRNKVNKDIAQLPPGLYETKMIPKSERSLPQNSYFHAVLVPEFRNALIGVGYRIRDDVEAKMILKSMFLTRAIENADPNAKPVHYVLDTSTLSKEQMWDLVEEVIQFAAENLNYRIPYPNERLKLDF
jgi:hypothetical protein